MKLGVISVTSAVLIALGCSKEAESSFPMDTRADLCVMLHANEETLKGWYGQPFSVLEGKENTKQLSFKDDAGNHVRAILEDRYGSMLAFELIFCPKTDVDRLLMKFHEDDFWLQYERSDGNTGYYFSGNRSQVAYIQEGCLRIKAVKPEPGGTD